MSSVHPIFPIYIYILIPYAVRRYRAPKAMKSISILASLPLIKSWYSYSKIHVEAHRTDLSTCFSKAIREIRKAARWLLESTSAQESNVVHGAFQSGVIHESLVPHFNSGKDTQHWVDSKARRSIPWSRSLVGHLLFANQLFQSTKPISSSMIPARPRPDGSCPLFAGGQAFCLRRKVSESATAAARLLHNVRHLVPRQSPFDSLQSPVHNVFLTRQLFRQFFLMVVEECWVRYND